MILFYAGLFQILVGLAFWVHPATKKSGFYGYSSYLAALNDDVHARAQRWARNALLVTGTLEAAAGWGIHLLKWDNFFIIWLLVAVFLFLPMFTYTEGKLKAYLKDRGELPHDYVDPDKALEARSANKHYEVGLRDRLKK